MNCKTVLFDYWRSSASYRVRLALSLKQIVYRRVPVNLAGGEQALPEHLARNPMAAVPVLDIDGLRLTQSLAIIEYLDETRDGHRLLADDPAIKAKERALALIVAADIHPLGNLTTLNRVSSLGGEQAKLEWVQHHISRGLTAFEAVLAATPRTRFCTGSVPGVADVCLVPQLYNAVRWEVDLAAFPHCRAIDEAFAELPAYHESHPDKFAPNG
ncbi:MAG: maleylacetoacetate isomerase [Marivita sp.]|uniref:maleylacetoacetate isomerase n=1 Tax=Marivita sp. TaxID=2003365 RepID=UPI001B165C33|nr:maleylacetoacetate isomerase [Marivita sp.]MBO6883148.1 maleylacetoacetate isomerase [Marivita sp.]